MRISAPSSSGLGDARVLFDEINAWAARLRGRWAGLDWSVWGIVLLAAFLRLLLLGMKPPHFDEGINGWFVDQMVKTGFYRYDPTNYHGPLHFYILFLAQTLLGRTVWALRVPVVAGSILSVWLVTKWEPLVGRNVSRLAALTMALSPGFVFYGRYSIHETWLLLFCLLFIQGGLGLWKFGCRGYLWCLGMGLTGMILTKETYIIHVGCALLALLPLWITHWLSPVEDARPARQTWSYGTLAIILVLGLLLIVFFYSGTFFNWAGVTGLYSTFGAWFKTGHNGNGHEKPWFYWLKLIARYEFPVLGGLAGCAFCLLYRSFTIRFLAIYGVGTLAAYSIVKYKTPWCVISVVWPLLFVFAAAILLLAQRSMLAAKIIGGLLLLLSTISMVVLNYYHCSTFTDYSWSSSRSSRENLWLFYAENEPYVYVQTYNDVNKLMDPLLKLVKKDPVNYQLVGHLIRPSSYPFPWLLGDFTNVGYYEHTAMPPTMDASFLVVENERIKEVEGKLRDAYFTDWLTIRPYQDTSKLYLNTKAFGRLFPNRLPEFAGAAPVPKR